MDSEGSQSAPSPSRKRRSLGKSKEALKLRGAKIAQGILQGKTQGQAVRDAGYTEISSHDPSRILNSPVIKKGYLEILEAAGADEEKTARTINQALDAVKLDNKGAEVPDHLVRLRAVDLIHRLRGSYQDKLEVDAKPPLTVVIKRFSLGNKEEDLEDDPIKQDQPVKPETVPAPDHNG